MNEVLSLGGETWELPPLPWYIVREVQPALSAFFVAAGGADLPKFGLLTTEQLDALAGVAWLAVAYIDPDMTRADFDELAFSPHDLVAAIPAVARACGLIRVGDAEVSPEMGKAPTPGQG